MYTSDRLPLRERTEREDNNVKKVPLQVYLDPRDRELLRELARRHGLSMAETLRAAIRRWGIESDNGEDAVLDLVGSIDEPGLPTDLSTRHDELAVLGRPQQQRRAGRNSTCISSTVSARGALPITCQP